MSFNMEDKVSYSELAPSLRKLFRLLHDKNEEQKNLILNDGYKISKFNDTLKNTRDNKSLEYLFEDLNKDDDGSTLRYEDDMFYKASRFYTIDSDDIFNSGINKKYRDSFLYNTDTTTFVFHKRDGEYEQISNLPEDKRYILNAKKDQPVNINKSLDGYIYDDDYRELNAIDDDYDLDSFRDEPLNLENIFNTGQHFSEWFSTVYPIVDATRSQNRDSEQWLRDKTIYSFYTKSLVFQQAKNGWTLGVVSNEDIYENLDLTVETGLWQTYDPLVRVDYQSRDRYTLIILGFMYDENGIFHDVSLCRFPSVGNDPNLPKFFIMYDACTYAEKGLRDADIWKVLLAKADNATIPGCNFDMRNNRNDKLTIHLKRRNGSIEAWTSDLNQPINFLDETHHIKYVVPDTSPDTMDNRLYQNIKEMLNGPSKIGFAVHDMGAMFKIIDQKNFVHYNNYYDIRSGKDYKLNTDTQEWELDTDNPNKGIIGRSYIYNPTLKKFFFFFDYDENGKPIYQRIGGKEETIDLKSFVKNSYTYINFWDGKFPTTHLYENSKNGPTTPYYYSDIYKAFVSPVILKQSRESQDRLSDWTSARLSNRKYRNLMVKYTIDMITANGKASTSTDKRDRDLVTLDSSYQNDDDPILFVVATMLDEDDHLHDISVVRVGGNPNGGAMQHQAGPFYIAYDALQYLNPYPNYISGYDGVSKSLNGSSPTDPIYQYCILDAKPYGTGLDNINPMFWGDKLIRMEVMKRDGIIDAWTSNADENIDYTKPNFHLHFELPSSKPSDWPLEKYTNIKRMLTEPSSFGFGQSSAMFLVRVQDSYLQS